MFNLLNHNPIVINIDCTSTDEVTTLGTIAVRAANKLDLNRQDIKSGLFASAAADTQQIVADRVLITHATSSEVTAPRAATLTFTQPLPLAGTTIDIAVVLIMPVNAGDAADTALMAQAAAAYADHATQLDDIKHDARQLRQITKAFI